MKLSIIAKSLAAVGVVLVTSSSYALSVSSALPSGPLQLSDNSAEYLIDRNANGALDIGDSLRGIFTIETIEQLSGAGGTTNIGGSSAYNELTGLYQVVVTSKVLSGSVYLGPVLGNVNTYNYTFGYDSTFNQGANVAVVLYDDSANNYRRQSCGGLNDFAACEATATGGAVWAKLGEASTTSWYADGAIDNVGLGAILPLNRSLGTFNVGMNIIENNTGSEWNKVACLNANFGTEFVDFCGQGGLLATGRSLGNNPTPYDIWNNIDFTANRIPEPGSLALIGLGLLSAGFARRRKSL